MTSSTKAEMAEEIAVLRSVRDQAFKWLAESGSHPPECAIYHPAIVPDGAHRSGLGKDFGGRYSRPEERGQCDCGFDSLHNALCQSTDVNADARAYARGLAEAEMASNASGRAHARVRK